MSDIDNIMPDRKLGGRLALLDPETITAEQRRLYDRIAATMGEWSKRIGFMSKTTDGRLIGPFNPVLLSPGIATAFLELQIAEAKETSLDERVRQIVILSIGSVWKAPYELYAHAAAARHAGFSEDAIAALSAGETPAGLTEQEQAARQFTLSLANERGVSDELYRTAVRQLGEKGLVDMVMLAGCYHLVCSLLNAFAVPAPERSPAAPNA